MKKKAIIFDLDNTIYPVAAISERLFGELFALIESKGEFTGDMERIKYGINRKPFQVVASDFGFSKYLESNCIRVLENLTYEADIATFEDYPVVKALPCRKFLVTAGFLKMQESKIDRLKIRNDFEECIFQLKSIPSFQLTKHAT